MKEHYVFVSAVKILAVLLVINSHFDKLYPIPILATGGALGVGLFFIVSGFCLCPVQGNFWTWIGRRTERVYLPALIMTLILIVTVKRDFLTSRNAFFVLVWPTMFWFVGGIFLYYVLYYMFRDIKEKKEFVLLFLMLTGIYFVCYLMLDTSVWTVESVWTIDRKGLHDFAGRSCKLIYGFAMMMAGKYLRLYMMKPKHSPCFYLLNVIGGEFTLCVQISYESISNSHVPAISEPIFCYLVCCCCDALGSFDGMQGSIAERKAICT